MSSPDRLDKQPVSPQRKGWKLGATVLATLTAAGAAVGLSQGSHNTQHPGVTQSRLGPDASGVYPPANDPNAPHLLYPGGPDTGLGSTLPPTAQDPTASKLTQHH